MQRVKTVLKLFALLLLVYLLLRICFGILYPGLSNNSGRLTIFYWGLRMDFAALFYINLPFLLYYFFLAHFLSPLWEPRLTILFFCAINLAFIVLNFIDLVYFGYNLRRSTIDIFYSLRQSVHSFGSLFSRYWFVLLAFIAFSIIFVWTVKKILPRYKTTASQKWWSRWLLPPVFLCLCLLVARGWGSRPIVPATALLHADARAQPLINNSTLNLLYSCLRSTSVLERKNYFTQIQLDSLYSIRKQYPQTTNFQKKNVVVFVLESFSADFFMPGPQRIPTPFFDSLMDKSTVCVNAFANGTESVKGLPAILASIPPFLDEPLFLSNYNAVPFNGIGSLLKNEGYST